MLKEKDVFEGTINLEDRCQDTTGKSQCPNKKVPGHEYCPAHKRDGVPQREAMYEFHRSAYMRDLAAKIPTFSKGPNKFDLGQELGILRLQLQETLNRCETDLDFLRNNQKISNIIDQIRRTVESSLKLDHKLGNLLSKDEMIIVAQKLIETIETHITDPDTIHKIVSSFETILTNQMQSPGPRGPYDTSVKRPEGVT